VLGCECLECRLEGLKLGCQVGYILVRYCGSDLNVLSLGSASEENKQERGIEAGLTCDSTALLRAPRPT
jgi:hypothetical protein